jgi:hypothetical protein
VPVDSHSPTANIIFNLAQLGIPLRDAELFDIGTYLEIVDIQSKMLKGSAGETTRKATQKDIDNFLL